VMEASERRVVESLLDGDGEKWRTALAELPRDQALRIIMATFANALYKQFPEDFTIDQIADYVAELRQKNLPDADLAVMPTELAIRGVLLDPELFTEISGEELLTAQMVVTNDIAHRRRIIGQARDEFVKEILDSLV
jgi:hypothetical protein